MGVVSEKRNDAVFVFGVAHELGFEPEVSLFIPREHVPMLLAMKHIMLC